MTEAQRRYKRHYNSLPHVRKLRSAATKRWAKRNKEHLLEYAATYRRQHRQLYREVHKRHRESGRKFIDSFKRSPCLDCGLVFPPYVMDFDHVRGRKLRNVSLCVAYPKAKILAEIKKCELVCSNCHRIRTHERSKVR